MEKILTRSCMTKFTVPHTNPSASFSPKTTEGQLRLLNHCGRLHRDVLFLTFCRVMGPNQSSLEAQNLLWCLGFCSAVLHCGCFLVWLVFFLKHGPGQDSLTIIINNNNNAYSLMSSFWDETQLISVSAGSTAPGAPLITDFLQTWIIMGLPTRNCEIPTAQREVQCLVPLGASRHSPVPNADAGRARR